MSSHSIEGDIEFLKTLTGPELEEEVLKRKWFVHPNDLIGGHCIMPVDAPPSSGCFEVADFISKKVADHVVRLHNVQVGIPESFADWDPIVVFGQNPKRRSEMTEEDWRKWELGEGRNPV